MLTCGLQESEEDREDNFLIMEKKICEESKHNMVDLKLRPCAVTLHRLPDSVIKNTGSDKVSLNI